WRVARGLFQRHMSRKSPRPNSPARRTPRSRAMRRAVPGSSGRTGSAQSSAFRSRYGTRPGPTASAGRAGLERGEVVRGVGEADGTDRRQRDAGITMRGHEGGERAIVADGAERAGEALGYRLRPRRLVVRGDLRPEAALLQHRAIERQREIAGQL